MSCDNQGVTKCNSNVSFEPNVLPFLVLLCAIVGVELFCRGPSVAIVPVLTLVIEPCKHANSSATLRRWPRTNEAPINGSYELFISTPPVKTALGKCKWVVVISPLFQSPFKCHLKSSRAISDIVL